MPLPRSLTTPALAVLAVAAACGPGRSTPDRPDIVLVTIDTLRADHSSLAGYRLATTPFLEELAADGVAFTRAYATSSWTAPSMASILTGRVPREHGIQHGFVLGENTVGQELLIDDFETLAEALASRGYRTLGLSTNAHLTVETGFAQGFDFFECAAWEDLEAVEAFVERAADAREEGQPLFVWLHWFDPHAPYEARAPWADDEAWRPTGARLDAASDEALAARELTRDELARRIRAYDSEVRAVDASLERCLERLDLRPGTVVAVTADHGESFLEHDQWAHGSSLHEEQVHVPLVLRAEGRLPAGLRLDAPVSNRRLFEWLLAAADGALDEARLRTSVEEAPVFLDLRRGGRLERAVVHGDEKLRVVGSFDAPTLIEAARLEAAGVALTELSAEAARTEPLFERLRAHFESDEEFVAPMASGRSTQEAIQAIRDLGYGGEQEED